MFVTIGISREFSPPMGMLFHGSVGRERSTTGTLRVVPFVRRWRRRLPWRTLGSPFVLRRIPTMVTPYRLSSPWTFGLLVSPLLRRSRIARTSGL